MNGEAGGGPSQGEGDHGGDGAEGRILDQVEEHQREQNHLVVPVCVDWSHETSITCQQLMREGEKQMYRGEDISMKATNWLHQTTYTGDKCSPPHTWKSPYPDGGSS